MKTDVTNLKKAHTQDEGEKKEPAEEKEKQESER